MGWWVLFRASAWQAFPREDVTSQSFRKGGAQHARWIVLEGKEFANTAPPRVRITWPNVPRQASSNLKSAAITAIARFTFSPTTPHTRSNTLGFGRTFEDCFDSHERVDFPLASDEA